MILRGETCSLSQVWPISAAKLPSRRVPLHEGEPRLFRFRRTAAPALRSSFSCNASRTNGSRGASLNHPRLTEMDSRGAGI